MKFKSFQFRWNEPLGLSHCPYMRRYVLILFGFGLRLHVWYRSDDKRYLHNHPWNFITFVLKGSYKDFSSVAPHQVVIEDHLKQFSLRWRKAEHLHYVEVPKGGCITLLFTMPPKQKWGFWINSRILRPLRYFSRYGHPPCDSQ
jgi:hypothetical protein